MADDNDDWFGGGDDDAPPEPKPLPGTAAAAAAAAPEEEGFDFSAVGDGAPGEDAGEGGGAPKKDDDEEEMPEMLDPYRLLLCKHWIRPRFLQYKYLFDYRTNYYNDVIDYLDKRQRGLTREIPRPQTWAERALRTYSSQSHQTDYFKSLEEDHKLAAKLRLTGAFYHYHTREYFNRKYSRIL